MIVAIVIVLIVSLIIFFVRKHRYIKRLKNVRDEIDFTKPEGKWLIRQYNNKIDTLNGYRLWKN